MTQIFNFKTPMSPLRVIANGANRKDLNICAFAPTKEEAMIKLLKLGPEPLPNLVRVTGWGELVTKTTLDTLIMQLKITLFRRHGGGAIFFKVSEGGGHE